MKVDKTTFCAAPWFQIRQNMDGTFKSCCVIKHEHSEFIGNKHFSSLDDWLSSDYVKYLRENLNNGSFLQECKACWDKEKVALNSLRTTINNTVTENKPLDQSWLHFYFKNKNDYHHDLLISADIKTSNICNFSCAMCNPADSSKIHTIWKKSKNHELVQEVLLKDPDYLNNIDLIYKEESNYSFIQETLDKTPLHLKLLGGEPLIDEKLLKILDSYKNKNKTNLVFVTNGSVDITKATSRFKDFRTVSIALSLEGISEIQDYIRRGSDWNIIKKNVENYIEHYGTENIYIHHTLQCLTLKHFPDLLNWTSANKIKTTIEVLTNPNYLSINAIPPKLFNNICINLGRTNIEIDSKSHDEITETISSAKLVNLLKKNYLYAPDYTKKLKTFVDWYDPEQEWKLILPEWIPYLD